MTHDAYSTKRVTVWDEERNGAAGKAIKYQDGYMSWCPQNVYERDYQPITAMSFGHAIHALKAGHKVARAGWNGKGMFLYLVPGSVFQVNRAPLLGIYVEGTPIIYQPHIDIRHPDGRVSTWAPSNGDALADDWYIVE